MNTVRQNLPEISLKYSWCIPENQPIVGWNIKNYFIQSHPMPSRTTQCHLMLPNAISCYPMPSHATQCHPISSNAISCHPIASNHELDISFDIFRAPWKIAHTSPANQSVARHCNTFASRNRRYLCFWGAIYHGINVVCPLRRSSCHKCCCNFESVSIEGDSKKSRPRPRDSRHRKGFQEA